MLGLGGLAGFKLIHPASGGDTGLPAGACLLTRRPRHWRLGWFRGATKYNPCDEWYEANILRYNHIVSAAISLAWIWSPILFIRKFLLRNSTPACTICAVCPTTTCLMSSSVNTWLGFCWRCFKITLEVLKISLYRKIDRSPPKHTISASTVLKHLLLVWKATLHRLFETGYFI